MAELKKIFLNSKNLYVTLREKCPYSKFFRSVFSHFRTEYGLRIQSECGKIRTSKSLNTDTFHAVSIKCFNLKEQSYLLSQWLIGTT